MCWRAKHFHAAGYGCWPKNAAGIRILRTNIVASARFLVINGDQRRQRPFFKSFENTWPLSCGFALCPRWGVFDANPDLQHLRRVIPGRNRTAIPVPNLCGRTSVRAIRRTGLDHSGKACARTRQRVAAIGSGSVRNSNSSIVWYWSARAPVEDGARQHPLGLCRVAGRCDRGAHSRIGRSPCDRYLAPSLLYLHARLGAQV